MIRRFRRLRLERPTRRRAVAVAVAIGAVLASPLSHESRPSAAVDDSTDSTSQVVDSPDVTSNDDAIKRHLGHLARRTADGQPIRSGTAVPQDASARSTAPGRGLISVVIPTHDRAELLQGAIESVKASPLIASPRQIVVVDDDSCDHTSEVAQQLGVTYVPVVCHSPAGSRNAGLAVARTPYVTFLDDDDVWLPGNMEPQLAALELNPHAGFAYGIAEVVSESLEPLNGRFPSPPLPSGRVPGRLHLSYPQLGVVLFRRSALTAAGGFDTRIRYSEDGDLMLRIAARHDVVGVDVVGLLYREREPSKERADYFWAEARREVMHWRPRNVDVGWVSAARFRFKTRGLFFSRFCSDAAACVALGHRHDALICLGRAVRTSPPRALRHPGIFKALFRQCPTEAVTPKAAQRVN